MPSKRVVAVIDDNLVILSAIGRLLSAHGYDTELYASTQEFLDAALTSEAICLVVDVHLGKKCGIELALHLAKAGFTTPIPSKNISPKSSYTFCFAPSSARRPLGVIRYIRRAVRPSRRW